MEWDKKYLQNISNDELDRLLDEADYCDGELLQEHDERFRDGRIKLAGPMNIQEFEEFFKKRCEERRRKKAS